MNELMIVDSGIGYLYYKTDKNTAKDAMRDFVKNAEAVGINVDNAHYRTAFLRDSSGEDFDKIALV